MKVLVCGGRKYADRARVYEVLDGLKGVSLVIEGGADGADQMANDWAAARNVESKTFYADWQVHGRAAGPIRNSQMLAEGKPDLVVCFPGGDGTRDMFEKAYKAGLQIIQVQPYGNAGEFRP